MTRKTQSAIQAMHGVRKQGLTVSAAVTMLLTAAVVHAQGARPALEEIIVTAERRANTEQTTSISMEVLSGDDLSDQQVRTVTDLVNEVPSLQVQASGTSNFVNIRGVGNNVSSPDVQMGVQVVSDGFTQGEPMGLNGAFLDVGSVEVLRGPQGMFIGQSAAGGAILINSQNPNFKGVSGFVEGMYGTFDRMKVTGAVNLPISDTFAARIAFNQDHRESFYKNLGMDTQVGGNQLTSPGSMNDRTIRVGLLWQPSDRFSALFKIEDNAVDNGGIITQPNPASFTVYTNPLNIPIGGIVPAGAVKVPVTTYSRLLRYDPADPFVVWHNDPGQTLQTNRLETLKLTYEFGNGMTLTSTAGYNKIHNRQFGDNDGTRVATYMNTYELGPINHSWSEELTLASPDGPNNWIVGAFYQTRNTPFRSKGYAQQLNGTCGWQAADTVSATGILQIRAGTHVDCNTPLSYPATMTYQNTLGVATIEALAAFGQYNWAITDTLELSVGGRINHDEAGRTNTVWTAIQKPVGSTTGTNNTTPLTLLNGNTSPPTSTNATTVDCTSEGVDLFGQPFVDPNPWSCYISSYGHWDLAGVKQTNFTYKAGLNWKPDDNNYMYVFFAHGYKAPRVNQARPQQSVVAEQVDDYEFGWKGSAFNGVLSGDIGFFYMNYHDMQGQQFTTGRADGSGSESATVADAVIKGVEASFRAVAGNLALNGSVGYVNSEIGKFRDLNTALIPFKAPDGTLVDRGGGQPAEIRYLPQCGVSGVVGGCVDYTPLFSDLSGSQQTYAPELSWNLSLTYDWAIGTGTLTPRVQYTHTDGSWASYFQAEDYYKSDARDTTDVSLTYVRDAWTVQAYINNVTDEYYISNSGTSVIYGEPMTSGLRVKMTF
ncbi:MAG: TonB-dependent receptor [Steroidobacteraceae bacterium]